MSTRKALELMIEFENFMRSNPSEHGYEDFLKARELEITKLQQEADRLETLTGFFRDKAILYGNEKLIYCKQDENGVWTLETNMAEMIVSADFEIVRVKEIKE